MKTYKYKRVAKNFLRNKRNNIPLDKLKKMNMSMMIKIPSEMEVAPCYELLTLFTLLILLALLTLPSLLTLFTGPTLLKLLVLLALL